MSNASLVSCWHSSKSLPVTACMVFLIMFLLIDLLPAFASTQDTKGRTVYARTFPQITDKDLLALAYASGNANSSNAAPGVGASFNAEWSGYRIMWLSLMYNETGNGYYLNQIKSQTDMILKNRYVNSTSVYNGLFT